jgi:hypothetical protein
MNKIKRNHDSVDDKTVSNQLLLGIERLIEQTGRNVAVYLNTTISRLYWSIGSYVVTEMQYETYSEYGQQILATLSQRLTEKFGKAKGIVFEISAKIRATTSRKFAHWLIALQRGQFRAHRTAFA